MQDHKKLLVNGAILLVAIGLFGFKYLQFMTNPWTRDGMVRADVVQIAPRVSGPITNLTVVDNQFVRAGDLLFEIDPRTFRAAVDQAHAKVDETRDQLANLAQQVEAAAAAVSQSQSAITQAESSVLKAQAQVDETRARLERTKKLFEGGAESQQTLEQDQATFESDLANLESARAQVDRAKSAELEARADLLKAQADLGAPGDENAQLRAAVAALQTAELDLEFSQVRAPVDGYVTNLNLRLGSQCVANQPNLALVDVNSFWVAGYFKETLIGDIEPGNEAVVTLMAYPDDPIQGVVESLGWGVSQKDGSTGFNLLPEINPTFEWIRLAQRISVRVRLLDIPEHVKLRVGTTASVLVRTGTGNGPGEGAAPLSNPPDEPADSGATGEPGAAE